MSASGDGVSEAAERPALRKVEVDIDKTLIEMAIEVDPCKEIGKKYIERPSLIRQ